MGYLKMTLNVNKCVCMFFFYMQKCWSVGFLTKVLNYIFLPFSMKLRTAGKPRIGISGNFLQYFLFLRKRGKNLACSHYFSVMIVRPCETAYKDQQLQSILHTELLKERIPHQS